MKPEEALKMIQERIEAEIQQGLPFPIELQVACEALKKQTQKKLKTKTSDEKRIVRCPNCNVNLSVFYLDESGVQIGTVCIGDVPPVSKFCKFCGQAFADWSENIEDWSEEEDG